MRAEGGGQNDGAFRFERPPLGVAACAAVHLCRLPLARHAHVHAMGDHRGFSEDKLAKHEALLTRLLAAARCKLNPLAIKGACAETIQAQTKCLRADRSRKYGHWRRIHGEHAD